MTYLLSVRRLQSGLFGLCFPLEIDSSGETLSNGAALNATLIWNYLFQGIKA